MGQIYGCVCNLWCFGELDVCFCELVVQSVMISRVRGMMFLFIMVDDEDDDVVVFFLRVFVQVCYLFLWVLRFLWF